MQGQELEEGTRVPSQGAHHVKGYKALRPSPARSHQTGESVLSVSMDPWGSDQGKEVVSEEPSRWNSSARAEVEVRVWLAQGPSGRDKTNEG